MIIVSEFGNSGNEYSPSAAYAPRMVSCPLTIYRVGHWSPALQLKIPPEINSCRCAGYLKKPERHVKSQRQKPKQAVAAAQSSGR